MPCSFPSAPLPLCSSAQGFERCGEKSGLSIEENDAIDALDESVLTTPKVPQDKKSFAAMNGVTFEIEFSDREEANEPQTRPQPEEIVTTRVISHPDFSPTRKKWG
ncbi:MAG: hypothetical protein V7L22_13855 [Nostoc sp.]|uniref:hypothetical protein n=1 Tax=Nostoc sp. TaxID=1180 RepID=UPI002FF60EA4